MSNTSIVYQVRFPCEEAAEIADECLRRKISISEFIRERVRAPSNPESLTVVEMNALRGIVARLSK